MGSTSHNMSTKPPIGIEQDESSSEPRFFFCCTIKSSLSLKWLDLSRRKAYACTCSQGDWWSSILINNFHLQERSNFNQQASTWRCILNPPTYTENLYKLVYIYVSRAGEVLLKLPWPLILLLYKNQTLQRFGHQNDGVCVLGLVDWRRVALLRPPSSRHYLYYVPWEKSSSTWLNKILWFKLNPLHLQIFYQHL